MEPFRADAHETVDAIPASATIVARVAGTFVNVHIAHSP